MVHNSFCTKIFYLNKKHTQSLIHYPIPVHQQKAYASYKTQFKLPITEKICNEILSLPMHPWLLDEEVIEISQVIKKSKLD